MSLDTPFQVYGPDPSALRLLIGAVLCAELDEFPPEPDKDHDVAQEIADKSARYAMYLSLFFIVSRRKRKGTSSHTLGSEPGTSLRDALAGSEVKGSLAETGEPLPEGTAAGEEARASAGGFSPAARCTDDVPL